MRTVLRLLTGLSVQLLGLVLASVLVLIIAVAVGGVSVHDQEMRSLLGARDERATRIAALTLAERLENHVILLESAARLSLKDAAEVLPERLPLLETTFDYGLILQDEQDAVRWEWLPRGAWNSLPPAESSLVLHHLEGGEPVFIAAAPLPDGEGRLLGAFSLSSVNVPGVLSLLRSNDFTEVLLVAEDGHVIFRSGPPQTADAPPNPGVALALAGESGAIYTGGGGQSEQIITFSPVYPIGWALVVTEPWEEITTSTLRISENTPLILLPGAFLSVLALVLGVWRIVRPLQRLEERAARMAWGDYSAIQEPVGGITEIGDLQRALSRMAVKVQQAENARQSYIGAITRGQEEERGRLARELHDETVQALIALGQRIQIAQQLVSTRPEEVQPVLAELRTMINQTLDDVRRIIRAMRPTYLEDLGLVPALRALCTDIERSHPLAITFRADRQAPRLPPDLEVGLYRTAQEALANVVRHAGASQVTVALETSDDAVTLTIADDGVGFDVPARPTDMAASGHYGLMTMAERVRLMQGRLHIESRRGQGTTVTIEVPLVPPPPFSSESDAHNAG
ncbi:MAG: hypothetical protein Kow0077_28570 [Anaerolineae bacterium]